MTNAKLHACVFSAFQFNQSLRILKLTQCSFISNAALSQLPDALEELYLMNTLINVDSWSNLKSLKALIIIQSPNMHSNNQYLLQCIADTLPAQILQTICIWDGEEENKLILQQLIESHHSTLSVFGIGGRICLYQPFSAIFNEPESKCYSKLQIITVSCLSSEEIVQLVEELGHQLVILEMYNPFVMQQGQHGMLGEVGMDVYQWLLSKEVVDTFCGSLVKLQVLLCQASPHQMKAYMKDDRWKRLREKFELAFWKHRRNPAQSTRKIDKSRIPLILFDFNVDVTSKISVWSQPYIRQYLIDHQQQLELNFGQGV
eukprot:CAMPEP_0197033370 /NCGR_PEP_ID=MMETSP1384-20130603/11803_1 /TAXON_ID=29189 /ORGANISM="Ammonia sp." /LENGTH=315 /DNA_ID=CAMNT_0042463173 /DNA_START=1 /DNA_END=948 /DNA_ORIENTATION=+